MQSLPRTSEVVKGRQAAASDAAMLLPVPTVMHEMPASCTYRNASPLSFAMIPCNVR